MYKNSVLIKHIVAQKNPGTLLDVGELNSALFLIYGRGMFFFRAGRQQRHFWNVQSHMQALIRLGIHLDGGLVAKQKVDARRDVCQTDAACCLPRRLRSCVNGGAQGVQCFGFHPFTVIADIEGNFCVIAIYANHDGAAASLGFETMEDGIFYNGL